MALPKIEAEIILSSNTVIGTFAGTAVTIPLGRYFLSTVGSGGATRSLIGELQFQLNATVLGTWTVTIDDDNDTSQGLVTITRDSNFTATWSSTALRNVLGFDADLTPSASSFTSAVHAKFLFLPNCGRSGVLSPQGDNGAIESDYTMSMGTDGTPYTLAYSRRYRDTLEFRTLKGTKTWISLGGNESYEQFYTDAISLGLRIRFHAARSSDSTFRTWAVEDGGHFDPTPVREDWTDSASSLWAIRHLVRKTT